MRRSRLERSAIYAIAAAFTFFAAFPVLWALNISLKFERDIITRHISLLPIPATLTNYIAIWTQSNLPDLMWNSAVAWWRLLSATSIRTTSLLFLIRKALRFAPVTIV